MAEKNPPPEFLKNIQKNVIEVGRKTILELLAKCYYNSSIKSLVEVLIQVMDADDGEMSKHFMQQALKDNGDYLLEILVECPDMVSRVNVMNLITFINRKLLVYEKDLLYEKEDYEYEVEVEVEGKKTMQKQVL